MLIPRALLVPHWPTLLEDELRRHRTPMLEALALEARRFAAERPEVAVVLSARWESAGPFHVGSGRFHRTRTEDTAFGVESRYDCAGHPELARALIQAGAAAGVRVAPSERGVDGGVAVPMHFLAPGRGLRVVPLSTAPRPVEECRLWGAAIRGVLAGRPERIGLVVGGMLSFATHAWNFRRDVPEAAELDREVVEALRAGRWGAIGPAADKWRARAHPEAGLRHLEVLRGFLGADLPGEVLCYESGPGMGAALAAFPVSGALSVAPPEEPALERARVERRARPDTARAKGRPRTREAGSGGKRKSFRGRPGNAADTGPPRAGRRRAEGGARSSAGSRTPRARGPSPASRRGRRPRGSRG